MSRITSPSASPSTVVQAGAPGIAGAVEALLVFAAGSAQP